MIFQILEPFPTKMAASKSSHLSALAFSLRKRIGKIRLHHTWQLKFEWFFKMRCLPPGADGTHSGSLQKRRMRTPQRSSWRAPQGQQWGLLSSSSAQSCRPQDRSQQSHRCHTASSSLHHSGPTVKGTAVRCSWVSQGPGTHTPSTDSGIEST